MAAVKNSSPIVAWLAKLAERKPEELLAVIKKEFEETPGGMGDTKIAECRVGRKIRGMCRYPLIPCFEHNRVALRDATDGNDFMHSNFVSFPNSPCTFIASMAPEDEPSKIAKFWSMINAENVSLIICLTGVIEAGQPKTPKYWPEVGNYDDYDCVQLASVSSTQKNGCTVSTLELRCPKTSGAKRIEHWVCCNWTDHTGPDSTENIVSMVDSIIKCAPKTCLIHCSAGVGRTGTFLCAVMLATKILANEKPDIVEALRTVRKQRAWSVQRLPQYIFLYDFCVTYILEKCDLGKEEKERLRNKMAFLKGAKPPSPEPRTPSPSSPPSEKPKSPPGIPPASDAKAAIQKAEKQKKKKSPKKDKSATGIDKNIKRDPDPKK